MRTTISLHERLAEAVKAKAAEKGTSVSAFIAQVLDDALTREEPHREPARPFRLVTVGGPGTHAGVDLDRPRDPAVAEDITESAPEH